MSVKLSDYLRLHWKALLNIVTILGMIALIYATRKQLGQTFEDLGKVHAWALLLLIPIEWLNYYVQAKLYQGLFKIVGNRVGTSELFKVSLELNFVNNIFPTVGASGIGYFGVRMRREGISGAKASLVHIMKLMLVLVAFEILLFLGLIFLAVGGRVNNFTILVAGSLTTLLFVLTFLVMYLVGSKSRMKATFSALNYFVRAASRILHIRAHFEADRFEHWGDELHENYAVIRGHYRELGWPIVYAIIANATEVAAVYVVYVAFGHYVNPGAIILAYAVANFAGLVSVLPGGVGVYEAIMLGVTTASGIRASLSLPVIIMYRVLNTVIQMPPGYYYYHRTLRGGNDTSGGVQVATE